MDNLQFYNTVTIIGSIVFIWNHSGFIYDLSKTIYKKLNKGKPYMGQQLPKPFSCSLCMVFWSVLIYGLYGIGLTVIFSLGLAVASAIASVLFDKLFGIFFKFINKIE